MHERTNHLAKNTSSAHCRRKMFSCMWVIREGRSTSALMKFGGCRGLEIRTQARTPATPLFLSLSFSPLFSLSLLPFLFSLSFSFSPPHPSLFPPLKGEGGGAVDGVQQWGVALWWARCYILITHTTYTHNIHIHTYTYTYTYTYTRACYDEGDVTDMRTVSPSLSHTKSQNHKQTNSQNKKTKNKKQKTKKQTHKNKHAK